MHILCSQGSLETIKLMFDLKPEQAKVALSMHDKENHTPLHKLVFKYNKRGMV